MSGLTVRVSASDDTPWTIHTGTYSRRYPYWVGRMRDGKQEYALGANGVQTRRFASVDAAQKVADKLQTTADFNDAREHARLAAHHLIRATNGVKRDHPLLATLARMSDIYLELTGEQL